MFFKKEKEAGGWSTPKVLNHATASFPPSKNFLVQFPSTFMVGWPYPLGEKTNLPLYVRGIAEKICGVWGSVLSMQN